MEEKKLEEKLRGLVIFTDGDGQGQATNTTLEEELGEYAMQKVLDLFSQELSKAREEVEEKFREKCKKREEEMNVPYSEEDGKEFWQGYQEGYHQGLKDMVVDTHYLDEEFQYKLTTK